MPRTHAASHHHPPRPRRLIWMWIGLGALLLLVGGLWIFKPGARPAAEPATPVPAQELSVAKVHERYLEGAFILDVRTQEEWNDYHIAGSHLIPLSELQDRLGELPRDEEIIVVCRSGHRSLTAVNLLQQAGFTRLASLSGGLQAWMDGNYPLEK
jgi:rhodanese-related sulfurtransferase